MGTEHGQIHRKLGMQHLDKAEALNFFAAQEVDLAQILRAAGEVVLDAAYEQHGNAERKYARIVYDFRRIDELVKACGPGEVRQLDEADFGSNHSGCNRKIDIF
ncbi:hypothetical protein SDC9_154694 [bioreactor metagenome]|uniref:Uncharacterized protein n=1 Tax=bioreactor metagenome TaxID=1076179 RepID=A0A645F483_9ZZZZ